MSYRKLFILGTLAFVLALWFVGELKADYYAVERDDGGVSVINYQEGSRDSLEDVVKSMGLEGRRIKELNPDKMPKTREDRDFWQFNRIPIGDTIKIDNDKKQEKEAEKQAKEREKSDLAVKLGITVEELEKIKSL